MGRKLAPATTSPKPDVRARKPTRIERVASRDLVGDQVPAVKELKCTFAGTVEIEPRRFLESGIKLVECPNCASTRSLSPRNGVLRFPSHDKRKTHTPHAERRWVRGKTTWEVVGAERKRVP